MPTFVPIKPSVIATNPFNYRIAPVAVLLSEAPARSHSFRGKLLLCTPGWNFPGLPDGISPWRAKSGTTLWRDPTERIRHGGAIVLPPGSQEVDYEAELVIVVGKRGRNIKESEAMSHVAGYAVGHDVSARDWQLKKDGKQWMVGKTFDTFAPIGPVLVTADEVPDPHNLPVRLRLNGQTMQDSSTSQMIFGLGQTLAYLSLV